MRTARLIARRPRAGDAAPLAAIYATPEAERWPPARDPAAPADVDGVAEVELHWSVRPDRHGRGYATEAAIAAAEAHLAEQQAASIVAFAHEANVASQAVARHAGFVRERELVLDGKPYVLRRRYSSVSASRNASSSASSIE